jgi:hypothetical protein
MRTRLPSIESIGKNAPLRLGVAAALAFPDGSMTASGLRRQRDNWQRCVRVQRVFGNCRQKHGED